MKNLRLFKNNEELSNSKDSLVSPGVAYVEDGQTVNYYPEGAINISVPKNLTITIDGKQYGEGIHQVKYNGSLTISKDMIYTGDNMAELLFILTGGPDGTKSIKGIISKQMRTYLEDNYRITESDYTNDLLTGIFDNVMNNQGYAIMDISGAGLFSLITTVGIEEYKRARDSTFENIPVYYDTLMLEYGG